MSKKVNYSNEDITIVWNPEICTHSAKCVKALPKVYNPKARPWLTIENATTEELKAQIKTCPSGALSFIEKK
ncbi:MAG: (4Fe-4S)-binding protein [Flavobacteriales bacterium]|nr:(4Fe-4S)-binding protein [Flavobacteriales bacterium]